MTTDLDVTQTATPAVGTLTLYTYHITEPGFYTVEALAPSTIRASLYGPFVMADDVIADNTLQLLMASGVGPLGCIPLAQGYYLVRIQQLGDGPYYIQLRPWRTQTENERVDL